MVVLHKVGKGAGNGKGGWVVLHKVGMGAVNGDGVGGGVGYTREEWGERRSVGGGVWVSTGMERWGRGMGIAG